MPRPRSITTATAPAATTTISSAPYWLVVKTCVKTGNVISPISGSVAPAIP